MVFWLGAVFLLVTESVDRNNFKTCDQSGFCKRLRNVDGGNKEHFVDPESLSKLNISSVHFTVKHDSNEDAYSFCFRVLEGNTVRLTAEEVTPVYPRYSPVDSLGEAPLIDGKVQVDKHDTFAELMFEHNKAIVKYNPFSIEIWSNGELVSSINGRGLFHIDTQLLKPKVSEEAQNEEAGDDIGITAEDLAKMDWEESFKSHQDSNPKGPRAISLDVKFHAFDKLHGLPEHADSFALKGTSGTDPYRLYNLDVFEYELNNPMALYGSIPYVHGLSSTKSVGMMWLNAAETWVDINYSKDKSLVGRMISSFMSETEVSTIDTHWMSESGLLDLFIFLGPKPKDVTHQMSKVFGPSYLPPLFGIAYHQCRWNYNDQSDIVGVDAGFDLHDIPMDVLWLDIEHTNGKRYFTWDSKKFPDSKQMLDSLSEKGRKMVTIVDPHIKVDKNWDFYNSGRDHPTCSVYVKSKDSKNFEGHCWPGTSSWIDYTSPCAREWWAKQFAYDKYLGSTPTLFTWNDMNEPSVFNGPEITMHKDNLHNENWEHRDVHNIYGLYMHLATTQGQILRSGNTARPFVLSRSFFVGSHRVGPIWTGDNKATWEHLKMSIPMLLSLNIAGYPFVGADVGGFFGNPNPELLVRWYQVGVFQPFLRAHAHIDTRRREPWLFGELTTSRIRNALRMRYQLLPYIYTQFYKASIGNTPIMRPLWYDHTSDTDLMENEREFMLGDSLLSSPVLEEGESTHYVTLPGAEVWYNYLTYSKQEPGQSSIPVTMDTMPLYIKGGSIIVTKMRIRRSSQLMADDPVTLIVAPGRDGTASGEIYIDDGHSFEFREGKFSYHTLHYDGKLFSSHSATPSQGFKGPQVERIIVLDSSSNKLVSVNGKQLQASFDRAAQTVTVKKPNVKITEEWMIEFS